jgi:hypothetical protein
MSEEMARKKKEEIEAFEKQETSILKETHGDICPACGLPTNELEFLNTGIIKTFGWVECTRCGNVYTPQSILRQKRTIASSGLMPQIQTA